MDNSSPEDMNEKLKDRYDMSKLELSMINKLEMPDDSMMQPTQPPAKLINSKSKKKNILRLNVRNIGIANDSNKRKKKSKMHKQLKGLQTGKRFYL